MVTAAACALFRLSKRNSLRDSIFRKEENEMKTAIAIVMSLALAAVAGCSSSSSSRGGVPNQEGFRISVPNSTTDVKQGEMQTIPVSLHRDDYFKQDVRLEITTTPGISIDPTSVQINASEKPDTQLRIGASKDAPLGEYRVHVKGTPRTGQPSTAEFNVKVVAP
jgi:hypothetical protein